MDLIRNIYENEYEEMEGEVYFAYIDKYIHLIYEKDIPMDYVYKTVSLLQEFDEQMMYEMCKYSVKYCKDTLERFPDMELDIDVNKLDNPLNILEYMKITGLIINMPEDMMEIGINLEGACDWAEEIGIQWLIKGKRVVYVGSWSMLDIWLSSYEESLSNYARNKC